MKPSDSAGSVVAGSTAKSAVRGRGRVSTTSVPESTETSPFASLRRVNPGVVTCQENRSVVGFFFSTTSSA